MLFGFSTTCNAQIFFIHWAKLSWWWTCFIYFWSKVNIWNANCARATAFIFDSRTDVLVKVSKISRQKMLRSDGDANLPTFGFMPNALTTWAIRASHLLSHVFEYWLWRYRYLKAKLTFEVLTACGQQHSFSTHERMFLWKYRWLRDRKCLKIAEIFFIWKRFSKTEKIMNNKKHCGSPPKHYLIYLVSRVVILFTNTDFIIIIRGRNLSVWERNATVLLLLCQSETLPLYVGTKRSEIHRGEGTKCHPSVWGPLTWEMMAIPLC